MTKIIKDRLSLNDDNSNYTKMPKMQSHGLWAKTEVMASYDDVEYDKNGVAYFAKKIPTGISSLGEKIFRKEKTQPLWTKSNMVPIGGCQFAMEMLFGVKADIKIPTLYENNANSNTYNVGLPNSTESSLPVYDIPGGTKSAVYHNGNVVQLFGVGITSIGENDITVPNVDYREYAIDHNRVITVDGQNKELEGTMIPFRYTYTELISEDKLKYFGKKITHDTNTNTNYVGYYLKRFDSDPIIKHIWKSGEEIENSESTVTESDILSNNSNKNVIESFTECVLKITKEDVKEWFIAQGQENRARINTIALFTGRYIKNDDGTIGDYEDVRMFSKLNIPVEYLSMSKDLNLIYRVYTS